MAKQFWAMGHGVISLCLAGCLTIEEAIETSRDMATNLMVSFGEDRASAQRIVDEGAAGFVASGELSQV